MKATEEIGVNKNTAVDYYNYCREVCTVSLFRNKKIGRWGITVEIDEIKFWKRKYNRGRMLGGVAAEGCVFGGIFRKTGELFTVLVERRNRVTLPVNRLLS
ncbi:unnamed protein product [Meganyctiphanes norvegica]|uniref:Transposase n=1 Tax=Meganyctiphanes norvegica TaxID=48144 RepID=A0AAV2SG00_MEGNR